MRLDKKLLELGLASTRSKAQRLIERNAVKVNGLVATKPSMEITDNDKIDVQQDAVKYVSLGGEKLEAADTRLNIMFNDCRVLDAGASTGGFTDYALQNGAKLVYAVDVGHGLLDVKLKSDARVKSLEEKDVRDLTIADIDDKPVDLIVSDLSFMSLYKVLPDYRRLLKPTGRLVGLVNPQFEHVEKTAGATKYESPAYDYNDVVKKVKQILALNGFDFANACRADESASSTNIEVFVSAVKRAT